MNQEELQKLMSETDDQAVIIAELQNGRDTPLPVASNFIEELEPERHKVMDPTIRRDKMVNCTEDDLETESDNITVINGRTITERTAKRREPVARIALAIQKLIVKRAVSFLFGNEVNLNAEAAEGSAEAQVLQALKRVYFDNKINTINRRVARSTFSSTEAAEYWFVVSKPNNTNYGFDTNFKLKCSVFSPLKGDTLFPYFDEDGDMIAFSREYQREEADHSKHHYFETFTAQEHIVWSKDNGKWGETLRTPNAIGKIPVIYAHQNETEWADVQGLIDRLEKLLSNFADTNDYHASPKIFTTGNITGWAKKGESGALIQGDTGATAQYLSWAQAPESVKLEIETLLRMIHTITQTPDISFDSVKGLNLSGVALKLLFMDAHLKVKDHAELFNEYLQRRNSVAQAYLAQMNAGNAAFVEACESITIEPEIEPYMLEDDQQKVQTLLAATGQKQILSQKNAVEILGWSTDPAAELKQIQDEGEAAQKNDANEQYF